MRELRTAITIVLSALVVPAAAGQTIVPKHFAAPAADVRSGMHALPSAERLTLSSRSAMIPLDWTDADGATVRVPMDGSGGVRVGVLSSESAAMDISLTAPGGERALAATKIESLAGLWSGADAERVRVVSSDLKRSGDWTVRVDHKGLGGDAWLAIGSDSQEHLRTTIPTVRRLVGEPIEIRAAFDSCACKSVIATITDPLGGERVVELELNKDGAAGAFVPDVPGTHRVHITAVGAVRTGERHLRTTTHLVGVAEPLVRLGAGAARFDGQSVVIPSGAHVPGEKVFVGAEVWRADKALCWIGGMVVPERDGSLEIDVDAAWFGNTFRDAEFQLRNVRVQDPGTWSVIDLADGMAMDVPDAYRQGLAMGEPKLIAAINTDRSLPNRRHGNISRDAGAHNLMLVHGYCSSHVWSSGISAGSFTGATEVFLDLEQNRTHDQFAQLIHAFGAGSKSYGIVAHSQGGAAALHLYTFYWSGLDWATGGTLIQSLGTPYQGTPLAGNLAILGDIFGTGCGENSDMTTDNAPLWLANIPAWARAEVNYYTTSFPSGGSACNFFSGLFLSNPEDGVIEVARGQLTGANNMGNTAGQCHSTGMSNPAQYQDQTRNQILNGAAAR